jgi:hypothetical protein
MSERPMQDGYMVVESFFDGATALREAFEAHFRNPGSHTPEHQIWNYWYVPESYTYLRTNPGKIVPETLVTQLLQRLNQWAMATLGLNTRQNPWLSLYVDGCGQTIHNDALNGQMGYVYSITKWDERNFLGGETLLFRPDRYWGTGRMRTSGAGRSFYELIPSRFNQLLVFDDRIIHGVSLVQGTMDPQQGRVVIHGHLRADTISATGPLTAERAVEVLTPTRSQFQDMAQRAVDHVHGFMTVRLTIAADGRVSSIRPLCDRLLSVSAQNDALEQFKTGVLRMLSEVRFPSSASASELTLPILAGA